MTRRHVLCAALLLAALTAAPSITAQPPTQHLGIDGRANEHVTAAAAGSTVALAWAATVPGGATDVYTAISRDSGASFAAPVRVNRIAGQARVNGEQPPRVAFVPRAGAAPELVVVWTAPEQDGTRLMTARSRDGGQTFGTTAVVAGSNAAGNRGWESLAVATGGRPVVMWLDHRDTATSGARHQHGAHASAPRADGAARAQLSQLFVGAADGSLPPRPVARGVCYCCKTALVAAPDGAMYAAWRHVYAGNQRDIAFAVSADGGATFSTPARVSRDRWQIDGCPENGPALAVDGARVHIVWPTLVRQGTTEALRLFRSTTFDGRTFSAREALPVAGQAYHPQVAAGSGGVPTVVWEETAAGGRRIKLWRGGRAEDLGAGTYPSIVTSGTHAIVAWSAGGSRGRGMLAVRRVRR